MAVQPTVPPHHLPQGAPVPGSPAAQGADTRPTTTEHLLVQVLARSVKDALGVLAGGQETEGLRARALSDLSLAFTALWGRLSDLALDLAPDGVRWKGTMVLPSAEDDVGFASMLVHSGIQQIAFLPGVETSEMLRLLVVLDRKRRLDVDGDLDLVTMLFRADFQHIRYMVGQAPRNASAAAAPRTFASPPTGSGLPDAERAGVGPAVETSATPTTPASDTVAVPDVDARTVRDTVREEARSPDRTRGIVELEKFDSTLYFLDQKEIEYLRGAIDREYQQDHAQAALEMLLDILQLRPEPEVRGEAIRILTTLMPYLLGTGRFASVAYLTSEIRVLTRSIEFEPEHLEALHSLRVGVSETRALAQLFHALDTGEVESTPENLGVLLRELRPQALQTVLVWVGQLTSAEVKSSLIGAIESFFFEWPATLGRMIKASDRTVVHRALGLAKKLRAPVLVEPIVEAIQSDDGTTRQLAVRALTAIGTAPAQRSLVDLLDDPDPDVRRLILDVLTARPFKGAEERLAGAIGSKDLESRDVSERRSLFEAYGAVAGPRGVHALEPLLLGKGGFGRRPAPETRACAAVALGAIGSPAARFALQKAAKDRDPLVRSAASSALRQEA